jgi:hypothetical protein
MSMPDRRLAHRRYLSLHLERVLLLLRARVQWLRTQWADDGAGPPVGSAISDVEADRLLRGGDAAAETEFRDSDPETQEISRRLRDLDDALAGESRSEPPPPIVVLGTLFGLSPFECDVLMLSLAAELDPSLSRLFAYVQDDPRRPYVTPHLVLSLLLTDEGERVEALASFASMAPLRRFRLLHLEAAPETLLGLRTMRLDDRVAEYLRGINRPDERIADLLRPLPATTPVAPHAELAKAVARSLRGSRSWPGLNLVGNAADGAEDLAYAVGLALGLQPYALDLRRLALHAGLDRLEILHLLERDVALLGAVLYLHEDMTGEVPELRGLMQEMVDRFAGPVIVATRERWRSERDLLPMTLPVLDGTAQRAAWQQALERVPNTLNGQVGEVVQQFTLEPRAIARTVIVAHRLARLRAGGAEAPIEPHDLWTACRAETTWQLEGLARRLVPCHGWADIVLPPDVMGQLRELAAQVAHRTQVYERWGFGARLNRGRGISALFGGPSGTGKTMAAEVLATELQLELIVVDLAGVVSKYIGETEKNLRQVFDAAERSGAILFFDEADALFGKRTEVKDSHDRYANIEVNYLLQRMEEYRGLAILATNRKTALDRAFLRRLRFLVDFPFPDADSRRRIWCRVIPTEAETAGLDFDSLARLEIPGGNIRNIALNAAFLAAHAGAAIEMPHVMRAARREYAKIDRPVSAAEFGAYAEAALT